MSSLTTFLDGVAALPEWQQRVFLVALTLLIGFLTIRIIIRLLDRSLRHIPNDQANGANLAKSLAFDFFLQLGNRGQGVVAPHRSRPVSPWADVSSLTTFLDGVAALPEWQQRVLLVALTLLIGFLTIRIIIRLLDRSLRHIPRVDDTLREFLDRLVDVIVWALLIVIVLGVAGVDVGALLGGLAIGGFVLGFALKDTLGNLAAGVLLLFYRPFNVGDTITVAGQDGDVTALGMALTTLKAADGRIVTLPNGAVLGGAIVNHTRNDVRRADVLVGIGYDDDIDAATRAILQAVTDDPRVLADPAPSVRITGLGASSVDLQVRPWVRTGDFWQTKADLNATVKQAVAAAGCTIPYPQTDVHVHQVAA